MSPDQARAVLARMLKSNGFAATIHRGTTASNASKAVQAHMTGFTPRDIVAGSGLQEGDSKVILAAADLVGWLPAGSDPCPRKGDWLTINGRNRIVVMGWPAPPVGGEVIRYEAQVR